MGKRIKFWLFGASLLLCALFYEPIALRSAGFLIQLIARFQYQCQLNFQTLEWREGKWLTRGLTCQHRSFRLQAPQAHFSWGQGRLEILQPQIVLLEPSDQSFSFPGFLALVDGTVEWTGGERAQFSLDWQGKQGTLRVLCSQGVATVEVDAESTQVTLQEWPAAVLAAVGQFYRMPAPTVRTGVLNGAVGISSNLQEIHGHLSIRDLSLSSSFLQGPLESVNGTMSYHSDLGAKWDLRGLAGDSLPIVCSGRTYLKSELSNWTDAELTLGPQAHIFVQGHEAEEGPIWTLRCQNLDAAQAAFFFPSPWKRGVVNGEINISLKEGEIHSWEVVEFKADKGIWDAWTFDHVEGSFENTHGRLQALLQGIPCVLEVEGTWDAWEGKAEIQGAEFTLKGGWQNGALCMEGEWKLQETLALRCPRLCWREGQLEFDVRLVGPTWDLARCKGTYGNAQLTLDQKSHLLGEPLKWDGAQLQGAVPWKSVALLDAIWPELQWPIPSQGELSFQCSGHQLTLSSGPSVTASYQFSGASNLVFQLQGAVQGEGQLSWGDQWEMDLDLAPLSLTVGPYAIQTQGLTHLLYTPQQGVLVQGLDLLSPIRCRTDVLCFDPTTSHWSLTGARLHLEGVFDGTTDLHWNGERFTAEIQDGLACVQKETFHVQDGLVEWDQTTGSGSFYVLHQEHCFKVVFEATASSGHCSIEERPIERPLTLYWNYDQQHGVTFQSMEGVLSGVDLSFRAEELWGTLVGSARVDFAALSEIISPVLQKTFSDLGMGKGFELKGRLSNRGEFQGILIGKDAELFGFRLQTVFANVKQLSLTQVHLTDIEVSDRAGRLVIDQILVNEPSPEELWTLDIPHISLFELRPSLLKRPCETEAGPLTPLVVRELHIDDLKGFAKDGSTYTAKGGLVFINSFRREFSVLDLPADLLSRIVGLDLELLIPVKGSLAYDLKDGFFQLKELQGAFSEGHRSEFFLVQEANPSMDLDGNLNIVIKMKQFVLFKLTESFLISIDGNLTDPKYHLQKGRKFSFGL